MITNGDMERKDDEVASRKLLALKLGTTGGGIGVISGIVILISGGSISFLTGQKEDILALGLLTIILSGFAIYCGYRSSKEGSMDINRRLAWIIGILVPAIVCFFTVGWLWLPAGALLIISAGLFVFEMNGEFREAGESVIISLPHWKRTAVLGGVLVILLPVVFGSFVERTELASFEDDEASYYVQPMDTVRREGIDDNTTSSEITGILLVNMILLIGGLIALVSGQLGARTITIAAGALLVVALLFFFFFIPNILFMEGAQMTQFDSDHFSSISGGWYMAMFGSLLIVATQFIKPSEDKDKSAEDH